MFSENRIYFESTHLENLKKLELLTQAKNWDSSQFNKIIIALGILGKGQSFPAINTPETIHLQAYRKYFDDLLNRTKETSREHSRAIFIDKEKQSVVMSGKISIGDEKSTILNTSAQPGREKFQDLIGTIHTHPTANENIFSAHGFSGQDYKSFIFNRKEQFMIVTYGESARLLVLKTSVTPNNLKQESIEKRINTIGEDFFKNENHIKELIDFNKMACVEFGLTLYMANKSSNDLFEKINVTE